MTTAEPILLDALPVWLDVFTMAFAGAYGSAVARHRKTPLSGVLVAGVIVGLGGGMIRDVLLGTVPVAITDWYYIPAVLLAGLAGATVARRLIDPPLAFHIVQGISLGLLVVIGCQKVISYQVPYFSAVLLGVVTATFGGAVADVFAGHRATIMTSAHWFLSAVVAGALLFCALAPFLRFWPNAIITTALVTFLRAGSVSWGWEPPWLPGDGPGKPTSPTAS